MSKWKRRRNDKAFQLKMAEKQARRRQQAAHTRTDTMYWLGVAHGLEQAQEYLMGIYEPMGSPDPGFGPDLLSKRKPRKAG